MHLNTLKPSEGSRPLRKRVGRGTSSGMGKTCGRGVKGQKSRSGGYSKVGFEGGQMPLQRRIPKSGFNSPMQAYTAKLRLSEIGAVEGDVVNIETLKAAGIITKNILRARVFASGEITRAVKLEGIVVTDGAKTAIEAAGGSVEA